MKHELSAGSNTPTHSSVWGSPGSLSCGASRILQILPLSCCVFTEHAPVLLPEAGSEHLGVQLWLHPLHCELLRSLPCGLWLHLLILGVHLE